MLTHVDLFSGIGGFALAARWAGVETMAFAETDPYASRVLERHFSGVRNYGDVRNVPAINGVWLVTGGFPCQPFSSAGKRGGKDDDRHLWPEMVAAIKRIRPAWVLGENVAGIIGMELDNILADLESEGYATQAFVIPACAVNALHRRNRVWICAYARHDNGSTKRQQQQKERCQVTDRRSPDVGDPSSAGLPDWAGGAMGQPRPLSEFERPDGYEDVDDAESCRRDICEPANNRQGEGNVNTSPDTSAGCQPAKGREIERDFRGVSHGVSRRVDRLKCLGNAIVPQVAYQLIKRMIEAEAHNENMIAKQQPRVSTE